MNIEQAKTEYAAIKDMAKFKLLTDAIYRMRYLWINCPWEVSFPKFEAQAKAAFENIGIEVVEVTEDFDCTTVSGLVVKFGKVGKNGMVTTNMPKEV